MDGSYTLHFCMLVSGVVTRSLTRAIITTSRMSEPAIELLHGHRVSYRNKSDFQKKLDILKDGGAAKLNIVSDFDFTLTRFKMDNGERGCSCYKVLEDCGLMTAEYHRQAQALQRHYYPLEVDPSLDSETRTKYMIEWVEKANVLLAESGLSQAIIETAVSKSIESQRFALRNKVVDFLSLLETHRVPLLIFSAGIYDVLDSALRYFKDSIHRSLLHVISNRPVFDGPNGTISTFEEPVIHVFNKKAETFLATHEYFKQDDLVNRMNLILLGDSLGKLSFLSWVLCCAYICVLQVILP